MKIENIHLTNLRNEEHFQFHTDFKGLIDGSGPGTLKTEEAYAVYMPIYNDESEALDVIRKSAITDDIAQADSARDNTFRGTADAVKSAGRHFRPGVQEAAARLQVVFDHYGNLTTKPYDEETAAITSLLTDLATTCVSDVATIGLTEWVAELKANNDAFDNLKKSRYTEDAGKTMAAYEAGTHPARRCLQDYNRTHQRPGTCKRRNRLCQFCKRTEQTGRVVLRHTCPTQRPECQKHSHAKYSKSINSIRT